MWVLRLEPGLEQEPYGLFPKSWTGLKTAILVVSSWRVPPRRQTAPVAQVEASQMNYVQNAPSENTIAEMDQCWARGRFWGHSLSWCTLSPERFGSTFKIKLKISKWQSPSVCIRPSESQPGNIQKIATRHWQRLERRLALAGTVSGSNLWLLRF